jgi:hypothetical protein
MSTSVAGSCCRGEHAIVRVAGMSREKTQGATPKRAGRRKLREGRSVSARVARCRELREKKSPLGVFLRRAGHTSAAEHREEEGGLPDAGTPRRCK